MKNLELKISPPILILVTALLMAGVSWLDILRLPIPFAVRCTIGIVVLVVGGIVLKFGVNQYAKAKTTWLPNDPGKASALLTGGIYRFSR